MKKKPTLNKDTQQRVKTPDITSLKKRSVKTKKSTDNSNINITPVSTNNLKKSILKQSYNVNMKTEIKPPKKAKIATNKEKKEEPKESNPTQDLVKEERPNSATKKLFKNKVSKKEKEKKNTEVMNKTGDNFYKPKTQIKKNSNNINNNIDKQRKKSVDIAFEKRNKKTDKGKTEKNIKFSVKLESNKTKRPNLNKTADTKKVKNHKKANKKEKEKEIKNIGVVQLDKNMEKPNDKNEIKEIKDENKKIVEKKEPEKDNKNIEIKENKKIENSIKKEENKMTEEKKEIIKEEKKQEIKKEEKKPEIKKEEKKPEIKKEEKPEVKKEQIKEKKEEKKIEEIKKEEKDEKKEEKIEELKKEEKNTENKEIKIEDKKEIIKPMKSIFMNFKTFSSNYKECLYLGLNSGFFNPVQKLNLMINSKELYENLDKNKLILELIYNYNKLGNKNLKNNVNSQYDIEKINNPFKPSERSINSLNFIDKEEENKLINELQHPFITDYFKLILILLNEKNNENKNIFEFIFKDLLEKYKVKNIKSLLLNNFVNSEIIINDEQFNSLQKMIMIKPDLLSPATLLRYNRAVAYSAFFLKDLFNYLNLKTEDGMYYYKLRTGLQKNEFEEKINKLKLLI